MFFVFYGASGFEREPPRVSCATNSEFAARSGRFLFVKRIIKADFDLLAGNIPHPRYAVGRLILILAKRFMY